jgi:hypothetical protein
MAFDGAEAQPNDHPLRESLLAFLHEDERKALLAAGILLERALLEFTRGGATPLGPRIVQGVALDLSYALDHAVEATRDWGRLHEDRHAAERRALESAVPHLRAALDALEPAGDRLHV